MMTREVLDAIRVVWRMDNTQYPKIVDRSETIIINKLLDEIEHQHNEIEVWKNATNTASKTIDTLRLENERLQHEFNAYRETAEETAQCYNDSRSDSWVFEDALRQITYTLDYAPHVGRFNGPEQRKIAREALEKVCKRREERAKRTLEGDNV